MTQSKASKLLMYQFYDVTHNLKKDTNCHYCLGTAKEYGRYKQNQRWKPKDGANKQYVARCRKRS